MTGSRIVGFHRLSLAMRRSELAERARITEADLAALASGGLDEGGANQLVENAVGVYALPLGAALNFCINGHDHIVPMAIEEPSVIAACSHAARMVRDSGGFAADVDPPIMTAQVELLGVAELGAAREKIERARDELMLTANALVPRLVQRGGGCRALEVRILIDELADAAAEHRIVVHVHIDCRDAMGANIVNTVAEGLAPRLAALAGGRYGLRILTNLCDRRRVRASARLPFAALATPTLEGADVARRVASAARLAELDPYRATTHNKGIMNGVDAVALATGNDWRAVEAGAHAFAAAGGRYRPLSSWRCEADALIGRVEMPLAVGTVGGTLEIHRAAQANLRLMGASSAATLSMVMACAGLASNLAALRALATEGIQRGHMSMHRRAVSGANYLQVGPQLPACSEEQSSAR